MKSVLKRNEDAFQMLEEPARQASSGAMRKVLQKTAAKKLPPLRPEDQVPRGFDRHALERWAVREAGLHRNRVCKIDSED